MYDNSSRGEALIDVIIGTAILGWFAVTMYGAVMNLTRLSAQSAKRIQGVWIANSYMEELLGLPITENDVVDYDDLGDFEDETLKNAEDYGFEVITATRKVRIDEDSWAIVEQDVSPPFTEITIKVIKGGLGDDEELVLQSLTPGSMPDKVALGVGTTILDLTVPADHLIIDYDFQSAGGNDLDTRSAVTHPWASQNLGYGQNGNYETGQNAIKPSIFSTNIFTHGGDNTGNGYESVYVDIKKLRAEQKEATEIKMEASAAWYGSCGTGDVELTIHGYVGGTVTDQGYNYVPSGTDEETGKIVFKTNTKKGRRNGVSGATDGNAGTACDLLAYVTYDWKDGTLRCLLPNSTADNPIECPKEGE